MSSTSTARPGEGEEDTGSSPDLFFFGIALLFTGVVFVGFWPTYFGPLLLGHEPADTGVLDGLSWQIHLHAAVFVGWTVLLLIQSGLIDRGKVQTHMKIGPYVAIYGAFVLVVGLFIDEYHNGESASEQA
ncbi:MAG: hypothetical protein V5A48_01920 [Salinivenus sp.]